MCICVSILAEGKCKRKRRITAEKIPRQVRLDSECLAVGSEMLKLAGEDYFSWICATWSKFLDPHLACLGAFVLLSEKVGGGGKRYLA